MLEGLMPSACAYVRVYILSEGSGRFILGQRFGKAEAPYYFLVDTAELFGFMPESESLLYEVALGSQNFLEKETIDLRPIEHGLRHPLVMKKFSELTEREAFLIINDHDPLPLYFQMAITFPKRVGWEYVEHEKDFWKIRIGRL
ncbi:MAG: DUF2249 domain-containing protein [Aquificota bacterium]|nr:MAG: DUF2249 domain-containing protein [Aquificota bacterium]